MSTSLFLEQIKAKCEAKSKQYAELELSIIDNQSNHQELKQHFGFSDEKISKRKSELVKQAKR